MVFIGGAGGDLFVCGTGDDLDRVSGFQDGADRIAISALANFGQVSAASAQVGANVTITVNADDVLTITNFSLADLDAGDFLFV